MREIKFRGYSEDLDKWVYGDLLQYRVLPIIFDEECEQHECFHSSIGQSTGLFDKNGVEIWEGDIVENTTQTVYLGDKYEVVWNKNYAGYQLMSNGFTSNIPLIQNFMSYKVIGNIYENPELLNVEQTGGTERKEREMEK